jgi:hypothetical protein
MHKKPYTYTESNQELIKRIELEKEFSKYIAKDVMSSRYGITTYCSVNKYDSTLLKKEICDWQSLKKPVQSRTYHNIRWERLSYHDPQPDWIQWGETAWCASPCPSPLTYLPPTGSPFYIRVDIPLDIVLDQSIFPNFSGNAELYAFSSTDGNSPWTVIGQATLPINGSSSDLGGGLIINIGGQLFFRYYVYVSDEDSDVITVGAIEGDSIKFVLVDGPIQYTIHFPIADWPTIDGTATGYHEVTDDQNIEGCFSCWNSITIQTNPTNQMFCNDGFQDCWFCGMIPTNPENPFFEENGVHFKCENDQECIYLLVQDQYYNPIPNYEIILDGELYGTTNEDGVLKFSIPQASTNNFHTINDCEFCFYTYGGCNQQKITITVNTDAAQPPCEIRTIKLNCKSGEVVDATIVTPDTPADVNTSWLCDSGGNTFNGCVEIVDSEGVIGYSTLVECEENCQPPPPVYRCITQAWDQPCICEETVGDADGVVTFSSIEECESCGDCCCNPPDIFTTLYMCEHDPNHIPTEACPDSGICNSFQVAGVPNPDDLPTNVYMSLAACNNECVCIPPDPITHFCQSGECIAVQDGSQVPAWILPSNQFTSLEDCENLCGSGFRVEAWMNINADVILDEVNNPNLGEATGVSGWFDAPYTCCQFVGMVSELGEFQYGTEEECNAMTNCTLGDPTIEADFPYTCLESFWPEDGVFQWTGDVISEIEYDFASYETLGSIIESPDFFSYWWKDNNDGSGDFTYTAADPLRLIDPNTKFIIVPVMFSENGQAFQSVDLDGNPYTYTTLPDNSPGSYIYIDTEQLPLNLTFDQELTTLVNTFHFKSAVDATKLMPGYYDMASSICVEENQSSSVHGIRTGGTSALHQAHQLKIYDTANSDGPFYKVEILNNATEFFYNGYGSYAYAGWNTPCMFNVGGHLIWLAFTYDDSAIGGAACGFLMESVYVGAACWEGGCPVTPDNFIDCAANSPYIFSINPDTTY